MGKPYGHQYFFAGSGCEHGTMTCEHCKEPIHGHSQDWLSYQKSKSYDWAYYNFHRKCREDQSGWEKQERDAQKAADKHAKNLERMKAVAAELKITAPYELACLAVEALGENPDFFFD